MRHAWIAAAVLAATLGAGCATKKGFEVPGQAFGCPIGEQKIASMEDLVKAKVVMEGTRTTVLPVEMRCSRSGDLLRIDANLNNDSKTVKRVSYKFRWMDREGMRAWEEEAWKPLMLYDNSNMMVNTVAPTNKVADFRLILRSQE
jgi:uncharacterized protein YcfL